MSTNNLIEALESCLQEIPRLKNIRERLHHPHVKAWKTKMEELLEEGGSSCRSPLMTLKKMKIKISDTELVKHQTYINQLDSLEKTTRNVIRSFRVFGMPHKKERKEFGWAAVPKSQIKAVGHLMIGDEEIASNTVTIRETLECLVSLAEDSNGLSDDMKKDLIDPIQNILNHNLYTAFLEEKLDALLGHWPDISSKSNDEEKPASSDA